LSLLCYDPYKVYNCIPQPIEILPSTKLLETSHVEGKAGYLFPLTVLFGEFDDRHV